jgi:AcrR family transcriptional regulator
VRPRGVPVTARGLATRRRILDAAEEVFGERGYYDASVSEITARAGVAQGTFYIYFDSKLQIFVELVEDVGKRLRAAMSEASAGATDRLDAERRGFTAFFAFVAQHRRIYHIVQEAERVAPQAAYAYYQRISAPYARALQKAMDAGTIWRTDSEALAHALMGVGHFVALRWLVWPRDGADGAAPEGLPDAVVDAVLDFITRGMSLTHEG